MTANRWCALVALCLAGCAATPRADFSPTADAQPAFYVVRRAQHTGIAISAAWWSDGALLAQFPEARYLEFGWGDATYYPAERKSLLMTLDAVFTPSASVMSVAGLSDISAAAPDHIERVPASVSELQALVASIAGSFAGDRPFATGKTRRAVEGELHFFAARGSFHFFRMCNHWTAMQLRAAGCTVGRLPVITAGRVLREASRCAAAQVARASSAASPASRVGEGEGTWMYPAAAGGEHTAKVAPFAVCGRVVTGVRSRPYMRGEGQIEQTEIE